MLSWHDVALTLMTWADLVQLLISIGAVTAEDFRVLRLRRRQDDDDAPSKSHADDDPDDDWD